MGIKGDLGFKTSLGSKYRNIEEYYEYFGI